MYVVTRKLECMNFREENVPSFSKICNLSDDGWSANGRVWCYFTKHPVIGKRDRKMSALCCCLNVVSFRTLSVLCCELLITRWTEHKIMNSETIITSPSLIRDMKILDWTLRLQIPRT